MNLGMIIGIGYIPETYCVLLLKRLAITLWVCVILVKMYRMY